MLKPNSIYQGDCLDLMKHIPDGSVDLILTDPPYCVGASSSGVKSSLADFSLIKPFFDQVFAESQRVLIDGGHCYFFTDWRTYPLLYPIMQKILTVRNLIVWDYEWIKAGNFYRYTYELIIFATKGKAERTFSATESDVWRMKPINFTNPNKLHKSEKPVALLEKIIKNSSAEGGVVLDCFAGSGSTAVACVNTGRQFIGFELDEHYFDVACDRIQQAQEKLYGEDI